MLPIFLGGVVTPLAATYSDLAEADEYVTTVIRFLERGICKPVDPWRDPADPTLRRYHRWTRCPLRRAVTTR